MRTLPCPVLLDDIDVLARTLYGEARGEGEEGQRAVAHVVLNRVMLQSWYGKTISGVCLRDKQFSCWNDNDPNRLTITALDISSAGYQQALRVACQAVFSDETDPTNGADHYHADYVSPAWNKSMGQTATIGRHLFYKA